MGAGRPTVIPMKNGLARGVRQASDFLMGLQLTGAAKADSIANLQVRLPVVVIGGGLTAIDTATEALAYYPVQVEKFLRRYETLAAERGEEAVRAAWTDEERQIADEFLAHARAIRAERERARRRGRGRRDFSELLDGWGGVTIAYRRRLIDAPSYTLNHEEVAQGAGGGHPLRGECLTPAGGRGGRASAMPPALARRRCAGGAMTWSLPARDDPGRGRHAAEHRAGARGRRNVRARRPAISRPATRTATR